MEEVLRDIAENDKSIVLTLRNQPHVRGNMYNSETISFEEHSAWWENLRQDISKKYYIYEVKGVSVGVVGFYNISARNRTADWAFYTDKHSPKGTGTKLEHLALTKAFDLLNIRKLNCEVLSYNPAVIRLHRKFCFEVEGVKKGHHFHNDAWHDIVMLSLKKETWEKHLKSFSQEVLVARTRKSWLDSSHNSSLSFTPELVELYAQLSGDRNLIHFSDATAKEYGFKNRIAHGGIPIAIISKILGTEFPGQGTIIVKEKFEFLSPIYLGENLTFNINCISQIGRRLILNVLVTGETIDRVVGEIEVLLSKELASKTF